MIRALAAALAASVVLVVAYLALGGGDYEPSGPPDPCRAQAASGQGLTGAIERVGLTGLSRSACNLGVSRERLLLSLAGEAELEGISDERRSEAFRAGLRTAIDDEQRAGRLGDSEAFLLRQGIELLPIEALIDQLFRGAR